MSCIYCDNQLARKLDGEHVEWLENESLRLGIRAACSMEHRAARMLNATCWRQRQLAAYKGRQWLGWRIRDTELSSELGSACWILPSSKPGVNYSIQLTCWKLGGRTSVADIVVASWRRIGVYGVYGVYGWISGGYGARHGQRKIYYTA